MKFLISVKPKHIPSKILFPGAKLEGIRKWTLNPNNTKTEKMWTTEMTIKDIFELSKMVEFGLFYDEYLSREYSSIHVYEEMK